MALGREMEGEDPDIRALRISPTLARAGRSSSPDGVVPSNEGPRLHLRRVMRSAKEGPAICIAARLPADVRREGNRVHGRRLPGVATRAESICVGARRGGGLARTLEQGTKMLLDGHRARPRPPARIAAFGRLPSSTTPSASQSRITTSSPRAVCWFGGPRRLGELMEPSATGAGLGRRYGEGRRRPDAHERRAIARALRHGRRT